MQIKVPRERAYYYELAELENRLTYWIPKKELVDLVNKKDIDKKILKDFPDGLDIEVYKVTFDEFKEKYNWNFDFTADDIVKAFKHIVKYSKREDKGPFPRTGYLNGKKLEFIAREMKNQSENTIKVLVSDKKNDFFKVKMTDGDEPLEAISKI